MHLRRFLPKDKQILLLWLIILIGFILRAVRLNYQSYWVDELHTMNESDPAITWAAMFNYLKCCDPHPPLYFIFCRIVFAIFGHTEFIGRFISLVFGTVSIWAMYFLGKEIYNKRLGLLAAALTSINYFHILYSQETRNYILVFLFTALSLAYFFRLLKNRQRRDMIGFAVMTLLMMYSHYFGLFIAFAEFVVALFFIVVDQINRKVLLKWFLLGGLIIAVGYAPWVPFFLAISRIHSFWIGEINQTFAKEFFYQYFGDSSLVLPFIVLLLIYYCVEVFHNQHIETDLEQNRYNNPLTLSFIVLFATTVLAYLIPYIRSILVVPMLFNRYTIVVVPAFLLAVAFALDRIRDHMVRLLVIGTIAVLSMTDLVLVKHYYTSIRKTQFRQITSYIVASAREDGKAYPIINQVTSWQQQYYITHWKYKGEIITGKKEDLIDSILSKSSPKFDLEGFWVVGFHGEGRLSEEKKAALDSAYVLVRDTSGFDAWGEFYLSQTAAGGSRVIAARNFDPKLVIDMDGQKVIPVWGGSVASNPVSIKKGSYQMSIMARGTPFDTTYPHLKIYLNDRLIDQYYTGQAYTEHKTRVEIPEDGSYVLKIDLDNDAAAPGRGDRNAFVKRVFFKKQ
jgi:uncharacterized membrane protein